MSSHSSAHPPLRVLVSRTDRIGDVVLTLPLCGLLKERCGAHVSFLGAAYTRDVLLASDAIDDVLEWDESATPESQRALLAAARADVLLHVFPRRSIAYAAWRARVPQRVGTSHRIYHWLFCNRLESLARKRTPYHEAQLNVRLARTLLGGDSFALEPASLAPYAQLRARAAIPASVAPLLAPDRFTLVVHPKSRGSAPEWPLASYRALIDALPAERVRVLVTGTAAEGAAIRAWLDALPAHAHDITGRCTLAELIAVLGAVDGMVGTSTGPLHLAAASGTPTLGLYSAIPPLDPGRWSPLGPRVHTLATASHERGVSSAEPASLGAIPVAAVRAHVEGWVAARAARRADGRGASASEPLPRR